MMSIARKASLMVAFRALYHVVHVAIKIASPGINRINNSALVSSGPRPSALGFHIAAVPGSPLSLGIS